ncbi:MAG: flippase-like domain-containing protein [Synergistaceae bacterium]|nr:flippase-like domain-containing protein [Synergistaceae bacterium]
MTAKKGLSFFVILSLFVSGAVLYVSVDRSSFEIFKRADASKLGVAILMVALVWLLDALKLKSLTRAAGERTSFAFSMKLTLINYFGAAVTPMQSGGGPFQIYMMYRRGIGVGKSIAITLVRTILTMLILGLTIPFTLMFDVEIPKAGWWLRGFVFYVVTFIMLAWLSIILSLAKPRLIKRISGVAVMFLTRAGFLKSKLVSAILRWINREVDAYNKNVKDLIKGGRNHLLLGVLFGVFQMWVYLSVMPCMIWAMGMPVMYVECVLIQALFLFMLYFIPTPGGSGAAEGGAAMIFSVFVPWSVAGMLGLGWRFLTEYTGIALGFAIAMKEFGWNFASSAFEKEKDDSGDDGGPAS